MLKLQFLVITIIFLYAMATLSSTSKDYVLVGNKNSQNDEVMLHLNTNQSQYEQGFQDQQEAFKKTMHKTSKYKGVHWHIKNKKWYVTLHLKGQKQKCGGCFNNELDAAKRVNQLCKKFDIGFKNPGISSMPNEQLNIQNKTSIYTGVSWHKDSKKWQAQLVHNKKCYYGGRFDNEEQAAMKVNLLCDKYEIERKHQTIDIEPNAMQQKPKNKTSIYTGVYWHKDSKKWQVQLDHNKKYYYGGTFDNEEHAAMKVNLLCDKYEMGRKNPTINIKPNAIPQKNQSSKFTGVSWHSDSKKWRAQLKHNYNNYYGGTFDNEEQAAMKVNLLCDKYKIERKHPTIDIEPNAMQQKKQTSKFTGVSWHKDSKKWRAELVHYKKCYYGGTFDNEEQAAMKVNLLCDKYEIEHKHPTIDIKPNEMQQNTKFIMYQSKSESIVNEDIKVEDENILDDFKDECQNRFMKSNEDTLLKNHANTKRKRKKTFKWEMMLLSKK